MYSGSKTDKQFVLPKMSKQGIRSDSRRDEIFQDTSWWMRVNLKPARCVKDLRTPHGVNLTVPLSNSVPSLPLFLFLQWSLRIASIAERWAFSAATPTSVWGLMGWCMLSRRWPTCQSLSSSWWRPGGSTTHTSGRPPLSWPWPDTTILYPWQR